MGTRTYSRRGVLTALGRRRAGLEAIDIFGRTIPGGTTPPPSAPVVPPAPVTPPAPRAAPRPQPQPKPSTAPTPVARPKSPRLKTNVPADRREDIGIFRSVVLTPAEQASLKANSPFDYSQKPNNAPAGAIQAKGPLKIDPARMSPEEITDKIIAYANKDGNDFDKVMKAFFESMQHSNPAKPQIKIEGIQKERGKKFVESAVESMFGMFDKSKMKQNLPVLKIIGSGRLMEPNYTRRQRLSGEIVSHEINFSSRPEDSPSTAFHEVAHAIEQYFGGVSNVINQFAQNRIQGLPRDYKPPISGFPKNPSNHVDNPYTLASRDQRDYHEVFSMGFESIYRASEMGDRQLIENTVRAIQQANGYYK